MDKILRRVINPNEWVSKDLSLLIYRVFISMAMIKVHGIKKLLDFQGTVDNIPDPLGFGGEFAAVIAIVANVLAPVFIIFGLLTRVSILPILGVTLMGFFIVHGSDPWSVRDVPLMYSLAYMFLFMMGPGKYSLDHYLSQKNK